MLFLFFLVYLGVKCDLKHFYLYMQFLHITFIYTCQQTDVSCLLTKEWNILYSPSYIIKTNSTPCLQYELVKRSLLLFAGDKQTLFVKVVH